MSHWNAHPHVRTGAALTPGERAADLLKKWFGTWTALASVAIWIAIWISLQRTPARFDPYPYILLNLCLSCVAAVQGIILQISANRGDRISSEVAMGTYNNAQELLVMNRRQLEILDELRQPRADLGQPDGTGTNQQEKR